MASFVTTWMEPEAVKLIENSLDVNMVDLDEYPSSTDIHQRWGGGVAGGRVLEWGVGGGVSMEGRRLGGPGSGKGCGLDWMISEGEGMGQLGGKIGGEKTGQFGCQHGGSG